ncbi:DNA repair protein RecO [Altererythrobacter sp. GH1-8]|uniref:DNA repair protein RecO n=1 Tax=Altererythrobacter sp. GH1-8 TaxID=3349333 RepID=UPI00374DD635
MHLRAPAILVSTRAHGETASIARLLTEEYGLVAGYVAGGRGRTLRPVLIPGNVVEADLRARSQSQLPFLKVELVESRGPWLTEPLTAAALQWVCALTATALPERNPYPSLYSALGALLDALCNAPSARQWLPGLIAYESLLLRELGYGGERPQTSDDLKDLLGSLQQLRGPLAQYLLADRRGDVMGARTLLEQRLARMTT